PEGGGTAAGGDCRDPLAGLPDPPPGGFRSARHGRPAGPVCLQSGDLGSGRPGHATALDALPWLGGPDLAGRCRPLRGRAVPRLLPPAPPQSARPCPGPPAARPADALALARVREDARGPGPPCELP